MPQPDDRPPPSTDCDNDPDVEAAWEGIIERGLEPDAPGRLEELEAMFSQRRAEGNRP